MKGVDGNYKEIDHNKWPPEVGHHIVHLAIISCIFPTDDECHSPYAQDNPTVASQSKILLHAQNGRCPRINVEAHHTISQYTSYRWNHQATNSVDPNDE